jgi:hypothetical protein
MPLCVHRDGEQDKEITLMPKAIIRTNEDGTYGKEEPLRSELFLELITGLANKGHKIGFVSNSWLEPIKAEKAPGASYWLSRGKETLGKNKDFRDQTQDVQNMGKGRETYILSLREILISVGVNYAQTGEPSPIFDKTGNMNTRINVSDKNEKSLQLVSFYPAAPDGSSPASLGVCRGCACCNYNHIGVVPAWKSIGT